MRPIARDPGDRLEHRFRVAEAYEQSASSFAGAADPLIYRILAEPLVAAVHSVAGNRPGPVLDVASGTGAVGRAFEDVVALDLAVGQLVANPAQRRVCADAESLPFRTDSFAVAACAFGINHLLAPERAVSEMARVASVVAVSTWLRPERAYAPKQAVQSALERQFGCGRSEVGRLLDPIGVHVGSPYAVSSLLVAAGLDNDVTTVRVEVPWPGLDRYLDYRLGMPSTPVPRDLDALRRDVERDLAGLTGDALTWRPDLVVGIGRRRPPRSAQTVPADQSAATRESLS